MTGRLIAIVGPSGVGKDSVMEAATVQDLRLATARRVITRPSSAGGEDFEGVSETEFAKRLAGGEFALSWQAHGLSYAIPAAIDQDLALGLDVMANLSRSVLIEASERFNPYVVLNLSASKQILAERLAARGRETPEQVANRLDRVTAPLAEGLEVINIDNSGPLAQTVSRVISALYPDTETRAT